MNLIKIGAMFVAFFVFFTLINGSSDDDKSVQSKRTDEIKQFWIYETASLSLGSLSWSGKDATLALLADDSLRVSWKVYGSHYEMFIHPTAVKIKKDGSLRILGWSYEVGTERTIGIYLDDRNNPYRMQDQMRQKEMY